jgi:hypothetical protein
MAPEALGRSRTGERWCEHRETIPASSADVAFFSTKAFAIHVWPSASCAARYLFESDLPTSQP